MTDSILITIKQLLNINADDHAFDLDIITHINTSFWRLRQLGVGQDNYKISGDTETWTDYLGEDADRMEVVKRYIYYDVRLAFDPPNNNASLYNAYRTELEKFESLIVYEVDPRYE